MLGPQVVAYPLTHICSFSPTPIYGPGDALGYTGRMVCFSPLRDVWRPFVLPPTSEASRFFPFTIVPWSLESIPLIGRVFGLNSLLLLYCFSVLFFSGYYHARFSFNCSIEPARTRRAPRGRPVSFISPFRRGGLLDLLWLFDS